MEKSKKTLLFCPLDWGLGHASRDIFIINKLIEKKIYKVVIGADKGPWFLLKQVFPDLEFIRFPSISIRYAKRTPAWFKIGLSFPRLALGVLKEHHFLKKLIQSRPIELVISDNRYGLWNRKVRSVLITHQLKVIFPRNLHFLEGFASFIIQRTLNHFDFCWVPDFPGDKNLGGQLSHTGKANKRVRFIGPVSRFLLDQDLPQVKGLKNFDVVVILSGPEPQRSILEKILIQKLRNSIFTVLIIRGIPWKKQGQTIYKKIQLVSHLPDKLFLAYLKNAKYIISRSGYSTLMDLGVLGLSAIIIPTPGQTEQEYLGKKMNEDGFFLSVNQSEINLAPDFQKLSNYYPKLPPINPGWIEKAIEELN